MIKVISFRVRGRVQGVGFRYSAKCRAEDLSLTGWIQNRPDGDVQGCASGHVNRIEAFGDWLWEGPTYANVTHVQIDEIDDDPVQSSPFAVFEIRR